MKPLNLWIWLHCHWLLTKWALFPGKIQSSKISIPLGQPKPVLPGIIFAKVFFLDYWTVHLLWSTKYQLGNSYSSIIFITSWSSNYEGNIILWHFQDSPFHINLHYNASLKIILNYILSLGISSLDIRWVNEFICRNIWGLKSMCHPWGSQTWDAVGQCSLRFDNLV